jgi:hypothetical protein
VVTTDAVKRDLAPLGIIETTISSIIVDPQKSKRAQNQQAIDNDIQGIVGRIHGLSFPVTDTDAKGK